MTEEAPKLPEPFGWLHDAKGNDPLTFIRGPVLPQHLSLMCSTLQVYSPTELREYARQAVLMDRERLAARFEAAAATAPDAATLLLLCAAAVHPG